MKTGHELFVNGLTDMLDGEKQLVQALQQLADDSSNDQLKRAFLSHRKETEGHVQRLNECFKLLGENPELIECKGIRGLIEEKRAFMEESPEADILDIFDVGAGIKTEAYEICEYTFLIRLARDMNHTRVAHLLVENLKEEKAALKKLEGFSQKLKPHEMMNEEEAAMARAASDKGSRRAA
jgi:ferritin-like metal-binding protein YciE